MTGEAEIKIPYEDLIRVTVVCHKCEGEITADVGNLKQSNINPQQGLDPRNPYAELKLGDCPLCGSGLDSGLGMALGALRGWYLRMQATGHKAFFRIKAPGPSTP